MSAAEGMRGSRSNTSTLTSILSVKGEEAVGKGP